MKASFREMKIVLVSWEWSTWKFQKFLVLASVNLLHQLQAALTFPEAVAKSGGAKQVVGPLGASDIGQDAEGPSPSSTMFDASQQSEGSAATDAGEWSASQV